MEDSWQTARIWIQEDGKLGPSSQYRWRPKKNSTSTTGPGRSLQAYQFSSRLRSIPLLLLFSEAGCPWCERARQEFLLPMQRNPEYRSKVMMREIGTDNAAALVDFAGKTTTQAEFARKHGVLMVPTVMLFGSRGEALAEPLVGFRIADYYGYFLDQRIDAALARLRETR